MKTKKETGVVVELPPELYAKLQFRAQKSGRSIRKEARQIIINEITNK